ncbi:hypothetical protein BcFMB_04990 [Bifidobacterium choerinum]|uniref:Uncharacterized protein n=1 Tax=Bifidobacterium choerinum TaxID=35760 RepID=A0A2D3D619_9BIFI|nr:hypothetical protein BcFMB_04990 [Bifidobacterium choerinum]
MSTAVRPCADRALIMCRLALYICVDRVSTICRGCMSAVRRLPASRASMMCRLCAERALTAVDDWNDLSASRRM